MFARWGDLVHRLRYTVIGVMVALLLGLAGYGLSLTDHLSQSGFDDPGSESVLAAKLSDGTFGRDATGDVVALYTAPEGSTVDDPAFGAKIAAAQADLVAQHPDQIAKVNISYFTNKVPALATEDKTKAIATFAIVGDDDTQLTNNFRDVKDAFAIDGVDVQLAGLQPIAGALNDTLANDVHRMEILAIPVVGILLFFIFGGIVAAALPLIIGGLTVVAANGVVRLFTNFVQVNSFVAPVVSLVGLGLAIDYGLFIVSRFREELGDGYSTKQAVRRSVMTAGRTVVFSATMIVASLGGLLLFPQGFLKSVAFGSIATVALAALTSITILPAMLSILGPRVDALGFSFMRKTKSSEEIEAGPWGRLTRWVMRNPLKVAIPIVLGLLLLTLPVGNIKFGGINESYLPPDNPTRVAQNEFDANFPSFRTEPLKIVLENAQGPQIGSVLRDASNAPGLVERFAIDQNQNGVTVLSAGLLDRNDSKPAIDYIRNLPVPEGATLSVTGTPAIEQDSIAALVDRLPLMAVLGLFGRKAFAVKVRDVPDPESTTKPTMGLRGANFIVKHPAWILAIGVVLLGAIAGPTTGLKLALPGIATSDPATSVRQAYDLVDEGFGPGRNGPLLIVADAGAVPEADRTAAFADIVKLASDNPDVLNAQIGLVNPAGDAALIQVTPRSSPNSDQTSELVSTLRAGESGLEESSGVTFGVTGQTALELDVSERLQSALIPYMAVVIGLAFLLLMLVFRSILVPLTATLGFLLSVLATFGATVFIFQEGGLGLISNPQPIVSFMPVFLIGVVFGLAMDYQVFLVSRMREAFVHGSDAKKSIVTGYKFGARVVTAAAVIMIAVFAAFIAEPDSFIKSIGFALAAAVFFDAFVVRMVLIPAVMALLGDKAWYLPKWLDKILPDVDIEGEKLQKVLDRSGDTAREPVNS